jgi:hypothetical protein
MLGELFKGLFGAVAATAGVAAKTVDDVAQNTGAPPLAKAVAGGVSGALALVGAASEQVHRADFSHLVESGSFSALWAGRQHSNESGAGLNQTAVQSEAKEKAPGKERSAFDVDLNDVFAQAVPNLKSGGRLIA